MKHRIRDLIGKKFGRLTILEDGVYCKRRKVVCLCVCGNKKEIGLRHILMSSIKSCGCYNSEEIKKRRTTHNKSYTAEYKIWRDVKNRCTNKKNHAYKNYGGRGIKVCDRWLESFENFYADMGKRPSPQHSIERRDNELGYMPENCYWATAKEQARNRRTNVMISYGRETLCRAEMAEKYGINYFKMRDRLKRGISFEELLSTPIKK